MLPTATPIARKGVFYQSQLQATVAHSCMCPGRRFCGVADLESRLYAYKVHLPQQILQLQTATWLPLWVGHVAGQVVSPMNASGSSNVSH
jgi:hypothetical protein